MSDDREVRRAKLLKRMEETNVGKEILKVLRQRLENSPTLQQTIASPDFKGGDYNEERKVLMSINNFGLGEGALVGISTFIVLRRGPQLILRLLNSRSSRGGGVGGGGGYKLDRPGGNSPFQQNPNQQQSFRFNVLGGMKLALDVFVSVLMAGTASFSVLDEEKLVNSVASVPLLEGKSVVSDEFCTTLQQEVAKQNPAVFAKADSAYLKGMFMFSKNCSKRQSYESKLREEYGLSPNESVAIPPGGVPPDYAVLDDDNNSGDEELWTSEAASNSTGGTDGEYNVSDTGFGDNNIFGGDSTSEAEKQWADSIVTDQEDDRRRK